MNTVFVEVIVNASDAAEVGIGSRDEIEDVVEEAFVTTDYGEVTGGGGGSGVYTLDIELAEAEFDEALNHLREVLQRLNVPQSTRIVRHKPTRVAFDVYN